MNPYQAIPDATVYVEAVCSRTGAPIVFVGKGEWGADRICRWYCREIALESDLAKDINMGRRPSGFIQAETIRSVVMLASAVCPTCGDNSTKYFRCSTCGTINCNWSVKEKKLGKWWHLKRMTTLVSTCGACRTSSKGMNAGALTHVEAVRDTGVPNDTKKPSPRVIDENMLLTNKQTGITKGGRRG